MTARAFAILAGLLCAMWLGCLPARADTAVAQYKTFRGNVNFTGTEVTLRDSGTDPCSVHAPGAVLSASLAGMPNGATVASAQLYWAGSGKSADATVTFDGNSVTAAATRQFASATEGYAYFGAAADVTAYVASKGNGTYTFSGLTVDNGAPWCGVQGVLGGFALVVVYTHPDEPFRMLNLYEGFQYFRANALTLQLGGFKVPAGQAAQVSARIGHVTWAGHAAPSGGGEDLLFNGTPLVDALNPSGNQFNAKSNVGNDSASYGIDFDAYTLTAQTTPPIQPGQSSATLKYTTGQDPVILGAEIVAMPYVASADLALAMTRVGNLAVGATAAYVLTVTNNGPDTETGPVTVVDTLPAGLKLASTSGSDWVCTNAAGTKGATIVTCSRSGAVAAGAAMAPLTLTVTPTATGTYTNSATVSGKTGDASAGNDTATNTGTATSVAVYNYQAIYTSEACKDGQAIVAAASETGCHLFSGPVVAGSTANVYLTAIMSANGKQTATALPSSETSVDVELMASCLPYASAATVSYAGLKLQCDGKTWYPFRASVKSGQPSAQNAAAMVYNNVGRVVLSVRYQGTSVGTANFIARPLGIRVSKVVRPGDGYSEDPATGTGFAKAGEPFQVRIAALMANGKYAPSFGQEAAQLAGVWAKPSVGLKLDTFTTNELAAPGVPVAGLDGVVAAALVNGGWTPYVGNDGSDNGYVATFSWFEAGTLGLTPWLDDYLGTGPVDQPWTNAGTPARTTSGTRMLGRFYPDHFVTDAGQNFDCPTALKCTAAYDAAKQVYPVKGGTYSGQPFAVTVKAYGLARADGTAAPLSLFQNTDPTGADAARTVRLGAVAMANKTGAAAGTLALAQPADYPNASAGLPYATATTPYPALANPAASFTLAKPYSADAAAPFAWSVPTPFYVRASMTESRRGAAAVTVDSAVPAANPPAAGTQYESGLEAMVGRLQLQNTFGSELLRVPVAVTAQYWSGNAWLTNTRYVDNSVLAAAGGFKNCTRTLATAGTACKANVIAAVNAGMPLPLSKGIGTLVLQAPGRPNVGSVDYIIPALTPDNKTATPPWLPSTRARATFGIYKSPVIYVREVY